MKFIMCAIRRDEDYRYNRNRIETRCSCAPCLPDDINGPADDSDDTNDSDDTRVKNIPWSDDTRVKNVPWWPDDDDEDDDD